MQVAGAVLATRYRTLNGAESVLFALMGHEGRAPVRLQGALAATSVLIAVVVVVVVALEA